MEINPSDQPAKWSEWQRRREAVITEFVKKIRCENPEVLLSTVIFPDIDDAIKTRMQDWSEWAEMGYVNFLVPMAHSTNTDWVSETVSKVRTVAGDRIPIYVGLAPYLQLTPLNLLQQIEKCREQKMEGVVLFDSQSVTDEQLRLLSIGPFSNAARPPKVIHKSMKL